MPGARSSTRGPLVRFEQGEEDMVRAIVTLLVLGLVGMTVLSLLFGVLMPLLIIALKVSLVLVVGYGILRLVSPSDAEKVRDKLNSIKEVR
jgi:fatty acid desaturase